MATDWLDLSEKVAHVTGGGRGIGAGIARALAACGASVAVSDVDGASAEAVAAEVGGLGLTLDVSDRAAVESAVERIEGHFGRLDIAVHNAGIYTGYGGPVRQITDEMWRRLWSVNVDGLFYGCRAAADVMIRAGRGGCIINLSSTQAVTPGVGVTYDGSKAAVAQITRSLALELAPHGIRVNAIAPGPIWVMDGPAPPITGRPPEPTGDPLADTVGDRIARLPLQRWGTPLDVGKAAVFLASSMSEFLTGAYLPVDGGWLTL